MSQSTTQIDFLKRKIEREKTARAEAEQLLELKSRELYIANQQLSASNENLEDIIAQRTEELVLTNKELTQFIDTANAAIFGIDAEGKVNEWNQQAEKVTGFNKAEVMGRDLVADFISDDHKVSVGAVLSKALHGVETENYEFPLLTKTGQRIDLLLNSTTRRDADGKAIGAVGVGQDITERRKQEKLINKMAHFDALTDVPNRSFFNNFIKDTITTSQAKNRQFALLIIDINDFKIANDRYGHQAGDTILSNVASIFKSHIKGYDLVARLGGDEFALILNRLPPSGTLDNLCNTLIDACDQPIDIDGNQLCTKLSIGIARYPSDGKTPERLLRCADLAMYAAKQNKISGSSFINYRPDLNAENTRKRILRDAIEKSLKGLQFHLEFQPLIEIKTGICHSCEALLRWPQKPSSVTIQNVIALAEESGLILPLSIVIIDQACRFIAELEARHMPQKIGVNLSAIQFQHQDLEAIFNTAIEKHQINPKHLQVEVTENIFLGNMDHAIEVLKNLSALGIEIYIDDFGTGYSSLKYLQILPVDWVKIDKSFIADLGVKDDSLQIITAAIKMTHSMGRRVVAEGVENLTQYQILNDIGCNAAQGYLISPALTGTECIEWIQNNQPFCGTIST